MSNTCITQWITFSCTCSSRAISENVCKVFEHWKRTFPRQKKLFITAINEQWKIVAQPPLLEVPPRVLKRSKEGKKNKGLFYLRLANLMMDAMLCAYLAKQDASNIDSIDENDNANDKETSLSTQRFLPIWS
ncbi:hypothetical protein BC829DRAFT_421169 [Chytridium lagenaria]|nr:hypothetical protein BC829DRAFT_421169 [Chytridium lagenaria]